MRAMDRLCSNCRTARNMLARGAQCQAGARICPWRWFCVFQRSITDPVGYSATEEGFGAMKEWTTPLDGLDPGEKYLVCVRARAATKGVAAEDLTSPWGKWSERSDDIQTSGKAKGLTDAGKAVGGLAGKLAKGLVKDIDLVTTGGAFTQKMEAKPAAADAGGFWDDALDTDTSVLVGEAFEGKVLELTANSGIAVPPEAREEVIKACHGADERLCMDMVAFLASECVSVAKARWACRWAYTCSHSPALRDVASCMS